MSQLLLLLLLFAAAIAAAHCHCCSCCSCLLRWRYCCCSLLLLLLLLLLLTVLVLCRVCCCCLLLPCCHHCCSCCSSLLSYCCRLRLQALLCGHCQLSDVNYCRKHCYDSSCHPGATAIVAAGDPLSHAVTAVAVWHRCKYCTIILSLLCNPNKKSVQKEIVVLLPLPTTTTVSYTQSA